MSATDELSRPGFLAEFMPKLVTVLKDGYGAQDLRADAVAGLTVAIVALPLSMAIAIASGVGPERGLFTAIVGGFLVSLLGGSRFQIGGPAGAFIVLVASCVASIGVEGLIMATFLSGIILMGIGFLRVGTYVKFIPYPVTVGFTAGIGIIILASQMKDFFGLRLAGAEPGEIVEKAEALWSARATLSWTALAVAVGTIAVMLLVKRLRPGWPNLLIGIAVASVLAAVLNLPVETIGSRFGELPRMLPVPELPVPDMALVAKALPFAVSFALLGAIESLLSAVVADGMSGRHHRSNAELVAQGVANMGSALFGGFCVTGTIARTATNVRAGSRGPVSGILHAIFVLLFMLIAAPLAAYIPLAALAGLLTLVAWNMIEKEEAWALLKSSSGDAVVLIATFLLVVFVDLMTGIVVGFALGSLVFISRMSKLAEVEQGVGFAEEDHADLHERYRPDGEHDVLVYHIRGAFFFGAAPAIVSVLDRIAERPRHLVLDFSQVPLIDSTAAHSLAMLGDKMARRGGTLWIAGAAPRLRRQLVAQDVREPHVRYAENVAVAFQLSAEAAAH